MTTTTMAHVAEVRGLTRRFRDVTALDDVSFTLPEHRITGLLGRNGAGKTTLMSIMTGQEFASTGDVLVFGADPLENPAVLERLCFIKESQKYPDGFHAAHVLAAAPAFFRNWSQDLADELVQELRLPLKREIKKLSRGQLSALGVTIGLASRAELTFFDEPYLGLDAVARQYFYDTLLADYAAHPRTVLLSTHLIDEVADLLEHVILLDSGKVLADADTDALRSGAVTVAGKATDVDAFARDREVLSRDGLGGLATVTIAGTLDDGDRRAALAAGLEIAPVSLQQLIIHLSRAAGVDPKEFA